MRYKKISKQLIIGLHSNFLKNKWKMEKPLNP